MKPTLIIPLLLLLLSFGGVARAQDCVVPVNTWLGTLHTNSGAHECEDDTPQTCITDSDSFSTSMTVPAISPLSACVDMTWGGQSSSAQAEISDLQVTPCVSPAGTNEVESIDTSTDPKGEIALMVDGIGGTYVLAPDAVSFANYTTHYCGSDPFTQNLPYLFVPALYIPPPAQTLPSPNVTPLSLQLSVTQQSNFGIEVPYDVTVSLEPDYHCQTCKIPWHSSVGPANQVLAEDLPIVGTGLSLNYDSSRSAAAGASSAVQGDAVTVGGWALNVHHVYDVLGNVLYLGDGSERSAWMLGTPVFTLTPAARYLVTSADGKEIYEFDAATGHHLRTLLPLTGGVQYQFGYDSMSRLISVTDEAGNVTTIERNSSGHPTAIVSPYGQVTTLRTDANGFLSSVSDPAGNTSTFTNTASGLITSRKDANGNVFTYGYDAAGHLNQDTDSLGGKLALNRAAASLTNRLGRSVQTTTALGTTTKYALSAALPWVLTADSSVDENLSITGPDGLTIVADTALQKGQLLQSISYPDDTSDAITSGPDPRFGIEAPVMAQEDLKSGSLTQTVTHTLSVTLAQPTDLTRVAAQDETFAINGRAYTTAYSGAQRSLQISSPTGHTVAMTLDSLQRVSSLQNGTLAPQTFTYDSRGRLSSSTQSTQRVSLTYDAHGNLSSTLDRLGRKNSFSYDDGDRMTTQTLPDGRAIRYGYDANGNVTSVQPPGGQAHQFAYDADDHLTSYTPPAVSGSGATSYTYDADERLTSTTLPGGSKIVLKYDSAGRVSTLSIPTTTLTYGYDAATGALKSASQSDGTSVAYGYEGMLPTKWSLSGAVSGSVTLTYDDNFWVVSQSVGTGATIDFQRDKDGLVLGAGSLEISRDANGMPVGTTLGAATDSSSYDALGQLIGYTAFANGTAVYDVRYKRDLIGRISAKTETIGGATSNYSYQYDPAGRLVAVFVNGVQRSAYQYDGNSNRTTVVTPSATVEGTYDAQDRLLSYGGASFAYSGNGDLQSATTGSAVTSYQYDLLGNLLAVTLPDGDKIAYLTDPPGHRIGRKVNGTLQSAYLYDGGRVVAELDGSNRLVSQFVYATDGYSPDYMIRGGVTYRFFSDSLGSPRLIVDTTTGEIAERLDYDENGNVTMDTQPGFQPFGFAGGLYDAETGLLRFGERDYSPALGRWTSKDPSLFAGGDTNLYAYAAGDPIDHRDPEGLGCKEKLDQLKKKAKQKVKDKVVPKKIKTPIGNISTERPEISWGVSQDITVGDKKVGSVDGELAVGVTPTESPSGPLAYADWDVSVTIGPYKIGISKGHVEFADISDTPTSRTIDPSRRDAGDYTGCLSGKGQCGSE